MTAEVSVINRLGVALAADSAVTIGPDGRKIYTSAEKLFQLAERAPVGVMVYGNANYLNVPWETVIKIYRSRLGNTVFDHLSDYVDHFLTFLKEERRMFPEEAQRDYVKHVSDFYFSILRENLKKHLTEYQEDLTEDRVRNEFERVVDQAMKSVSERKLLEELPDGFLDTTKKQYTKVVKESIASTFGTIPKTPKTDKLLINIIFEVIQRDIFGFESGIVIAGFGDQEHFPSLIELQIEGMVAGCPLAQKRRQINIDSNVSGSIVPFAQREMVDTFMQGIDPYLQEMIEQSTMELFKGIVPIIFDGLRKRNVVVDAKTEDQLSKILQKVANDIRDEWSEKQKKHYWGPIVSIVSFLPKDELAATAEAMVNLTKFKRRVSDERETVGGPIDVAVISKGDGFVWIKHKHYFNAQLNPRFMAKYYQGGYDATQKNQKI